MTQVLESKLFSVTIFKTQVPDNDYLKSELVPKITHNSQYLEIPEDWTTDRVKTSYLKEPEGLELLNNGSEYQSLLFEKYNICFSNIFDKQYEMMIGEIWYNFYSNGEYQEEHDHLGDAFSPSHFSCIHFLSFDPEQHKLPQFRDPISQLRVLSLELDRNNCGEIYEPNIKEGDLLMFPSYLKHRVPAGKPTEYPRITISFNIKMLKYD